MLRWISMFGGLLIMMGHHARSEALFYYFRLDDQVPENHLLRLIDKFSRPDFFAGRLPGAEYPIQRHGRLPACRAVLILGSHRKLYGTTAL